MGERCGRGFYEEKFICLYLMWLFFDYYVDSKLVDVLVDDWLIIYVIFWYWNFERVVREGIEEGDLIKCIVILLVDYCKSDIWNSDFLGY